MLLVNAKQYLGVTHVGGFPIESDEAAAFLRTHPRARSALKASMYAFMYSATTPTIDRILNEH